MKENKNIECDGLELYTGSIELELEALQKLKSFINGAQDVFELYLDFGYYGIYFTIRHSVNGNLLLKAVTDYLDGGSDSREEFTDKVTLKDFVEFLDNKLYENEYAFDNYDTAIFRVRDILLDFTDRVKNGYYSH